MKIEYKCKVECDKLWHTHKYKMVDCDINCVVSCELYNNPTNVYIEKNVYAQC